MLQQWLDGEALEFWLFLVSFSDFGIEWLPSPAATAGGTVVELGFAGELL